MAYSMRELYIIISSALRASHINVRPQLRQRKDLRLQASNQDFAQPLSPALRLPIPQVFAALPLQRLCTLMSTSISSQNSVHSPSLLNTSNGSAITRLLHWLIFGSVFWVPPLFLLQNENSRMLHNCIIRANQVCWFKPGKKSAPVAFLHACNQASIQNNHPLHFYSRFISIIACFSSFFCSVRCCLNWATPWCI